MLISSFPSLIMIPTKRSSPFVRARSFQNTQGRKGQAGDGNDGPSPSKRSSFATAKSSPFQVLSPSLINTKNPFEKLSQSSVKRLSNYDSSANNDSQGNPEDEDLDPNQTLKIFSLSQLAKEIPSNELDILEESAEDEVYEELDQESAPLNHSITIDKSDPSQYSGKPNLRDALAKSAAQKRLNTTQELLAPESSAGSSKKPRTDYKTSFSAPLDWTLKNSLSITSLDSLSWCDQNSAMDEIEALQHFVSNSKNLGNILCSKNDAANLAISAKTRLLSATYHWIYPANSPTISQAQSINKLLNTGSQLISEKRNISELFSRTEEWKQSFTALYQTCRNGACPYFYYVGTTWTILFKHRCLSMSNEIEAILTNSTPGLREVLAREDINFERLPNTARKTTVHNFNSKHDLEGFGDDDAESKNKPDVGNKSIQQSEDHNLSDTLLFKGSLDVHGLFNYLLNLKASYEDGFLHQSPSLIAGVPFLHAALKRAQLSKFRVVSRHIEGTEKMQEEFRVDIHGTLLPTSVKELSDIFADQQRPAGYSCIASSDARSLGLNLRPLLKDKKFTSEKEPFISSKALDQLRYNYSLKEFSWLP